MVPVSRRVWAALALTAVTAAGACTPSSTSTAPTPTTSTAGPAPDAAVAATKIKHIVVVMQENRSFDSYFGTYPGADGLPMSGGVPVACVPVPSGGCQRPFH